MERTHVTRSSLARISIGQCDRPAPCDAPPAAPAGRHSRQGLGGIGMSIDFEATRISVARLDERLRPIANRPVDVDDPDWVGEVASAPDPLEQTGLRAEARAVLAELLDAYAAGPDELRTSIRRLLGEYSSFTWAARVEAPMTTADGFRRHLLRVSAVDRAEDLRDAMVSVRGLCEQARSAGVDVGPILSEVAALSSDESVGAMGSVRGALLAARQPPAAGAMAPSGGGGSPDVEPQRPATTRPSTPAQLFGLLGWLLVSFCTGAIGGLGSVNAAGFYGRLVQPSWAPPAWLFGPAWSLLYVLMGVAAWLVWREHSFRGARPALALFAVQLVANALWSWLFFAWQLGAAAFAEIVLLWLLIAATVALFWRLHRLAALLLLPYLAWVSFAAALNLALWRLNPAVLG